MRRIHRKRSRGLWVSSHPKANNGYGYRGGHVPTPRQIMLRRAEVHLMRDEQHEAALLTRQASKLPPSADQVSLTAVRISEVFSSLQYNKLLKLAGFRTLADVQRAGLSMVNSLPAMRSHITWKLAAAIAALGHQPAELPEPKRFTPRWERFVPRFSPRLASWTKPKGNSTMNGAMEVQEQEMQIGEADQINQDPTLPTNLPDLLTHLATRHSWSNALRATSWIAISVDPASRLLVELLSIPDQPHPPTSAAGLRMRLVLIVAEVKSTWKSQGGDPDGCRPPVRPTTTDERMQLRVIELAENLLWNELVFEAYRGLVGIVLGDAPASPAAGHIAPAHLINRFRQIFAAHKVA